MLKSEKMGVYPKGEKRCKKRRGRRGKDAKRPTVGALP